MDNLAYAYNRTSGKLTDNKLQQVCDAIPGAAKNWREQQLYGSSRLGMWTPNMKLADNNAALVWDTIGHKQFELSNHLGNVMAIISDRRLADNGSYQPEVLSAQDYYAFGSQMPGRSYSISGTVGYRYGFNGKENDNESREPVINKIIKQQSEWLQQDRYVADFTFAKAASYNTSKGNSNVYAANKSNT